jgi:hypothetical protein
LTLRREAQSLSSMRSILPFDRWIVPITAFCGAQRLNRRHLGATVRCRHRWAPSVTGAAVVNAAAEHTEMAEVDRGQTHDALREGLFVRALGRPSSANPYPQGSDDHTLWENGWRLIDSPHESFTSANAEPRSRLVPHSAPVAIPSAPRQDEMQRPKPRAPRQNRVTDALRILTVLVSLVAMLIALQWEDAIAQYLFSR